MLAMTFPQITVKATNLELSPGLSSLIDQKLTPLGKLISDDATDGYCRVEVTKLTEHQSGKIYRVEVNLFAQGKAYRTEATEEQVEKAIDEVRDELKRELEHVRGKQHSLVRRGARALKKMLRFE
jgi:ribosomal subunit interface protein